ncbi:hypothetical protein BDN72DRAFT_846549 [Pluteus cervinus]|uniref:Uncharacterized protein n=1 Tax=Pluteus cervinus TaxID=181527 RepID=A0ACD3AI31_9AGAR|nr:hypothetical protein BDN72DRAFT_846549 [Pluteus cervinus]
MEGLQHSDETQAARILPVEDGLTIQSGSINSLTQPDPRFPPEIEHKIFVIAFYDDHNMEDTGSILSVSRRVYEWLIPLVYEMVIIHHRLNWPPMGLPPQNLPRYGKCIRHLRLKFEAEVYLTHTPNLVNLSLIDFGATPKLISALANLRVAELVITLSELPKTPELSPFCANITHLDCFFDNWAPFIGPSGWFSYFPNLTHLVAHREWESKANVEQTLRQLEKLQVFILCAYVHPPGEFTELKVEDVSDDPRVVHLVIRGPGQWWRAAQGGLSQWQFAEEIVERRKKKTST